MNKKSLILKVWSNEILTNSVKIKQNKNEVSRGNFLGKDHL